MTCTHKEPTILSVTLTLKLSKLLYLYLQSTTYKLIELPYTSILITVIILEGLYLCNKCMWKMGNKARQERKINELNSMTELHEQPHLPSDGHSQNSKRHHPPSTSPHPAHDLYSLFIIIVLSQLPRTPSPLYSLHCAS